MKLNKKELRRLIIQEINKMEEDALRSQFDDRHRQAYHQSKAHHNKSCQECGYSMYEEDSVCEQCGSMNEKHHHHDEKSSCDEHGHIFENGACSECGIMEEAILNEGGCGCDTTKKRSVLPFGGFSNLDDTHRHDNNYMAKPSLYKVAKYATKLLEMIPDGHELDDWQRSKIAQISDDISEVYHSLDYDKFEGDL